MNAHINYSIVAKMDIGDYFECLKETTISI